MITNYSELKAAVADFIHRTDLTTNIPVFIQLAESKIANAIKGRQLETTITSTLTAGVATLALPGDYDQMKSVIILSNPQSPCEPMSSDRINQYNALGTSGVPQFYSIEGNNIMFSLPPDAAYSVKINYYADLVQLSDTITTNWVLSKFPYLYLYGSLIEASIYTNDPDQVQFYQQKYDEGINDVIRKFGDESFSGGLHAFSDYVV